MNNILIILGGKIWPKEYYCVSHVESPSKNEFSYWERYHVCVGESISEGYFARWLRIVDFGLFPGLFIISLVFLIFTFILVYIQQRDKLFG